MSSPVMIGDSLFAGVCSEVSPGPKAYPSAAAREPKQAFADTAPLAKIREELKSGETDSPQALVEGAASGEQVLGGEPHPEEPTAGPAGPPSLTESEPTDIESGEITGQAMTPPAEGPVAQGNPVAVAPVAVMPIAAMPAEVRRADVGGEASVSEQPIIASPQVMPGLPKAMSGGQQVAGESQGLVNTGVTDGTESVVQTGGILSAVEGAVDSAKSAPIQGSEGVETSQSKADAAVIVPAQGEMGGAPADAGPVVARDPSTESEVGIVARHETGLTAPETTEPAAKAPEQSREPIAGEDAKAANPENDSPATGISEAAQRDPSRSPSASNRGSSQENSGAQPQAEAQPTATDAQDKEGRFSDAKEGTKSQTEVLVSAQSGSSAFAERLSVRSAGSSGVDAPAVKSPIQDVGEQILGSLQASLVRGEKALLVRLDPPELGSVVVRFREQGDQVSGVIEVSNDDTRRDVEQALPQVLRSLQEAGLQVRRLEVTDQAARDLGKEQTRQDAWAQRDGSDQQGEHPEGPHQSGWSALRGVQQSPFEQGGTSESLNGAGQGRIDMLI